MDQLVHIRRRARPREDHHPRTPVGPKAIVVIDNTAAGPAIGGPAWAGCQRRGVLSPRPRHDLQECAAGLPHGGAKSVIFGDPSLPAADKERLVRAFAAGSGTSQSTFPAQTWAQTRLPWPGSRTRSDARSVCHASWAASRSMRSAQPATVCRRCRGGRGVFQGPARGREGRRAGLRRRRPTCRPISCGQGRPPGRGLRHQGRIADPNGLDIVGWRRSRPKAGAWSIFRVQEDSDDIVGVACDIWIPAARPDVLREDNVDRLKARLVLQGANIPATSGAEQRMHERGILSIPDFIANAGGVISAAVEYRGGTQRAAFDAIAERIAANTRAMLDMAKAQRMRPREAAIKLARARIERAMSLRRWQA